MLSVAAGNREEHLISSVTNWPTQEEDKDRWRWYCLSLRRRGPLHHPCNRKGTRRRLATTTCRLLSFFLFSFACALVGCRPTHSEQRFGFGVSLSTLSPPLSLDVLFLSLSGRQNVLGWRRSSSHPRARTCVCDSVAHCMAHALPPWLCLDWHVRGGGIQSKVLGHRETLVKACACLTATAARSRGPVRGPPVSSFFLPHVHSGPPVDGHLAVADTWHSTVTHTHRQPSRVFSVS